MKKRLSIPTSSQAQILLKIFPFLMTFFLLSGCVTTMPEPQKVFVNVPVPCVKKADLPKPADVKPDAELAKLDDAKLILTIAAERLDLKRYANETSALLGACVE